MKNKITSLLVLTGLLLSSTNAFSFHAQEPNLAQPRGRHISHRDSKALNQIHRFQNQTQHFHRQLKSSRNNYHVKRSFNNLENSWRRVENNFHVSRADRSLHQSFLATQHSIRQLRDLIQRPEKNLCFERVY